MDILQYLAEAFLAIPGYEVYMSRKSVPTWYCVDIEVGVHIPDEY